MTFCGTFRKNVVRIEYATHHEWLYVCIWLKNIQFANNFLKMPKIHLGLRVNPHSIVAWMSRNSLLEAGAKSEGEVTATGQFGQMVECSFKN